MQIAFAWNSESEKELLSGGFEKREILLKFLDIPPTEENIAKSDTAIKELKPIHFVSTGFWTPQAKEQDSIVQIILAWRYECSRSFFRQGFKESDVYTRDRDCGNTTEERNKNGDSQFFNMTHPPSKFVTTSYWSPGSGMQKIKNGTHVPFFFCFFVFTTSYQLKATSCICYPKSPTNENPTIPIIPKIEIITQILCTTFLFLELNIICLI